MSRQVWVTHNAAQQFDADLDQPLCPAPLLRFESVDLYGEFCRHIIIKQIDEAPAHQLRTVTEIGIFGERVMLPAAGKFDRLFAPHTGSAVKIEECAGAVSCHLFNNKVAVEHNRLDLGEQ